MRSRRRRLPSVESMTRAARARERPPPSRRLPARLRQGLWRWRRVLLVVVLALSAHAVVAELRPAPTPTAPVVVAARELAAGSALAAGDLRVAAWPEGLHSDALLADPQQLVGERLALGVPAGLPVTDSLVVGPGVAAGAPPGYVAVPVLLADVGGLLRPGDRVSLVAAAPDATGVAGGAEVVARDALVLAALPQATDGLLGAGGGEAEVVVMAVPRAVATAVVAAGAWAPLRVLLD